MLSIIRLFKNQFHPSRCLMLLLRQKCTAPRCVATHIHTHTSHARTHTKAHTAYNGKPASTADHRGPAWSTTSTLLQDVCHTTHKHDQTLLPSCTHTPQHHIMCNQPALPTSQMLLRNQNADYTCTSTSPACLRTHLLTGPAHLLVQ